MAGTKEAEVEEKLLHVMAPPPAVYYSKYTKESVQNNTAPRPPPIPSGGFTAFGISHNVSKVKGAYKALL